jgi:Protein of unknown function (DUF1344)
MRTVPMPAILVSTLFAGTAALAAFTAFTTLESEARTIALDPKAKTLQLDDGHVYNLPDKSIGMGLVPGERVMVTHDQDGTQRIAHIVSVYEVGSDDA